MATKAPILMLALLALGCGPAFAQADAERLVNLAKAATDLAQVQKKRGPNGVTREVTDCYAREMPTATSLTLDLETCMAQEMMFSLLFAAESRRLSPEIRKERGLENPDAYLQAVSARWMGIFGKFDIPEDERKKFSDLVSTRALPIYSAALRGSRPNQR